MEKLQRFPTLIPVLQSTKIIEYLESLKEAGMIDSDEEYNNMLRDLLAELDPVEFKPLYKTIKLQPGLSSSNLFNHQLNQLRRDLEVLFIEFSNISSVIKAHSEVFKDKYLDQIKFSLKDLKAKMDNLQVVRGSPSGFNDVSYSIFSDLSKLLNRNNENAADLYQDLRRLIFIENKEVALVDKDEEVMTLPLDLSDEVLFLSVEVDQTNTTATEFDISLSDFSTQNILDKEIGTYWYYNVLTRRILSDGAKLVLHFDLNDKKETNYLVLQSVAEFPMFIESIEYIDEFDRILPLETSVGDGVLEGIKKFTFETVTIQKIILTLKQFNMGFFSYNKSVPPVSMDDLKRNTSITPNLAMLSESIDSNIEDPIVKSNISITKEPEPEYEVLHHYAFGLDNAFMGSHKYLNNGFFVTKPINIPRAGQVALESSENIATSYDIDLAADFLIGSFEYDLIKKDYSGKSDLIATTTLPILPVSTVNIPNERLFFTTETKIIPLRFPGHNVTYNASNVKVYRNNQELIRGLDWRFSNRSNPGDDTDFIITLGERTTKIEILHSNNTISNGIYVAEYSPQHILNPESEVYYDAAQTILYLPNGNIEFKIDKMLEVPEISDIFLKISVRNNSFINYLTPKLNYYKLFYSTLI